LPFGIQVVGRRREDVLLFGIGREMERELKGRMVPDLGA
jgi:Asp-tRNA(Asn)/Glu-tRNA(Gln) amidotransferase A subunit family amidase